MKLDSNSHNWNLIYTDNIGIRWRDVDSYGMVNHSVFFTLMEEVRLKWFANCLSQVKLGCVFPILESQIKFEQQLKFPDNAIIKLFTDQYNGKVWDFYHEIYSEKTGKLCAKATITSICFELKQNTSVIMPEELKAALFINNKRSETIENI